MPHSLRVRLGNLRYKGIISDKDYTRLCNALDLEKQIEDIKAEIDKIADEPAYQHEGEDWQFGLIIAKNIIDKHISGKE